MIYLFNTSNGGVIATGENGAKRIEIAIREELLKQIKEYEMKQKLILHDNTLDRDMYFNSYEEMAKHLDVKASKLKRIVNTGEIVNYIYQVKTK